ncbi:MAG: DNA polymerase III subunit gamma/tau [Geobacteraceae bacterium]|nr:DNA polymerase III subunit gamma/tau [Geobacteraceae bacterium]
MSYQVLALKWRPALFADLVGQEHVSRTLTNAILGGRVHHAFVFTGARGVGKTSAARILAKALNCPERQGAEPCNKCESCREIAANQHDDVIEIDGASNNGVDNVRELRDMARYMPASAPYKMIIIDEVHMLSTAAFNALLKILEEPPEHVKFIFATTEPHKIPVTILSRCQRYDFRKISQAKVTRQLEHIAAAEQIDISIRSLRMIAQAGGGSMRDSLSTFDQVLAFCPDKVEDADVMALLGVVDRRLVVDILEACMQRRPAQVFETVRRVDELGHSFRGFCQDLVESVRTLILARVVEDARLQLGISEDEYAEFEHLAKLGDAEDWHRLLSMLIKVESEVSASAYPRLLVEMALVRAASLPPAHKIEDLLRKLEQLEAPGSAQGSGGGPSTAGGASHSSTPAQSGSSIHLHESTPSPPEDQYTASSPPPARVEEQQYPRENAQEAHVAEGPYSPAEEGEADAGVDTRKAAPDTTITSAPGWEELVQQVRKKNPRIGALLDNVSLLELAPPLLRLGAPKGSFLLQQLKDKNTQDKICELAQILLGEKINFKVEGLAAQQAPPSLQQSKQKQETDRSRRLREDAVNHPIVRKAVEIFAGEVVGVTPNDKGYV